MKRLTLLVSVAFIGILATYAQKSTEPSLAAAGRFTTLAGARRVTGETSSASQFNLNRLNSVNITVKELRSFEAGLQNGSLDGNQRIGNTTAKARINALRVVFNCINQKGGAVRPSEDDLSKEQRDALRSVFNKKIDAKTIKEVTAGKKFSSISKFVEFFNSTFD